MASVLVTRARKLFSQFQYSVYELTWPSRHMGVRAARVQDDGDVRTGTGTRPHILVQ